MTTQTNLPATPATASGAPVVAAPDLLMPATVEQFEERKKRIDLICDKLMVPGTHWTIVGEWDAEKAKNPKERKFLTKAGAEMFCTQFGLVPSFEERETALPGGHREYRVHCKLHTHTGLYVGEGPGSCSTMESKYRYRVAHRVCPACSQELRKSKQDGGWYCWTKTGGCGATFTKDDPEVSEQASGKVENPDLADAYNTVLQMAYKRSHVAATRISLGLSDKYGQDEDMVTEPEAPATPKQPAGQGTPTNGTPRKMPPNERIEADTMPDQYKLEAPRSSYRGKTLAEIHAQDANWIPAALKDPRRKAACTKRDVANLTAFWAVMGEAERAQRACETEFGADEWGPEQREEAWAEAAKLEAEASNG